MTRSEGREDSGTGIMPPVHLHRGGSAQLSWSTRHNRKPTRADPQLFPCDWPGPRGKDFNLNELCVEAQSYHIPDALPKPLLKTLPFY